MPHSNQRALKLHQEFLQKWVCFHCINASFSASFSLLPTISFNADISAARTPVAEWVSCISAWALTLLNNSLSNFSSSFLKKIFSSAFSFSSYPAPQISHKRYMFITSRSFLQSNRRKTLETRTSQSSERWCSTCTHHTDRFYSGLPNLNTFFYNSTKHDDPIWYIFCTVATLYGSYGPDINSYTRRRLSSHATQTTIHYVRAMSNHRNVYCPTCVRTSVSILPIGWWWTRMSGTMARRS